MVKREESGFGTALRFSGIEVVGIDCGPDACAACGRCPLVTGAPGTLDGLLEGNGVASCPSLLEEMEEPCWPGMLSKLAAGPVPEGPEGLPVSELFIPGAEDAVFASVGTIMAVTAFFPPKAFANEDLPVEVPPLIDIFLVRGLRIKPLLLLLTGTSLSFSFSLAAAALGKAPLAWVPVGLLGAFFRGLTFGFEYDTVNMGFPVFVERACDSWSGDGAASASPARCPSPSGAYVESSRSSRNGRQK